MAGVTDLPLLGAASTGAPSDDQKIEIVLDNLRELIVDGELDAKIKTIYPDRSETIASKRSNALAEMCVFMNKCATAEGRILSSHHNHLHNLWIKEKVKGQHQQLIIDYVGRVLQDLQNQSHTKVTKFKNVKNYNLLGKLSFGLPLEELLLVVNESGSMMRGMVYLMPKLLNLMPAVPSFLKRCKKLIFRKGSGKKSTSSSSSSSNLQQLVAGICATQSWCRWKATKKTNMLEYVVPWTEENIKRLEDSPNPAGCAHEMIEYSQTTLSGEEVEVDPIKS